MIFVRNHPLNQETNPMRKPKGRRPRSGFTLMEIMVVMALLVVFASTSGLAYLSYHKRALRSAAVDGIRTMEFAVETYLMDNGRLPENLDVLGQLAQLCRREEISRSTASSCTFSIRSDLPVQ